MHTRTGMKENELACELEKMESDLHELVKCCNEVKHMVRLGQAYWEGNAGNEYREIYAETIRAEDALIVILRNTDELLRLKGVRDTDSNNELQVLESDILPSDLI